MIMRTVRNQPRTAREDLVNDLKAAGTIVTKKTIGNHTTLWRTVILQRPQGPPAQESTCTGPSEVRQWFRADWVKVLWSDETKIQLLWHQLQLAVFGEEECCLWPQEHHPHRQTWRWKHYALGVFLLLRGQDNCTASKGRWTGPCTVRARALKPARGIENGSWIGIQDDNDPKTHCQGNKGGLKKKHIKSWSGLASLQTFIP